MSAHVISLKESHFYRRLLSLALPIMLQNLLANGVSFVDTLMISTVGEEALAAVGLANQMFFLIILFFFGVSSGTAIFVSQYWGSQDRKSMHSVIGIALVIALVGAVVSAFFSFYYPELLMHIFTRDAEVVQRGKEYLVVVAVSYIFSAIVLVLSAALRSTNNAKTPLMVSILAMSINIVLNYLLILGKFGFPRMEVAGAALATSIARFIELVVLIVLIYKKKNPIAAPLKEYFNWNKTLVTLYLVTCLPVILNEMLWSLGMTAYKVAYARLGMNVIASINVSESIHSLFFVVLMGISNSTAIMIGNKIGEGDMESATSYVKQSSRLALASAVVLGFFLIVLSRYLVMPFNLSSESARISQLALVAVGLLFPLKASNMVYIVGVLRSGGDTRYSMLIEMIGVWGIGVPLAFFGAIVLALPLHLLILLVGTEELFKLIVSTLRVRSGKWITRLTDTPPVVPAT